MNNKIKILVIILALALIASGIFFGQTISENTEETTDDQLAYVNEHFGFSFSYPEEMVLNESEIEASLDDETKESQFIRVAVDTSDTPSLMMNVMVNPAAFGACEGWETMIESHQIGELTFSGCQSGDLVLEFASIEHEGNLFIVGLAFKENLRAQAEALASSFTFND